MTPTKPPYTTAAPSPVHANDAGLASKLGINRERILQELASVAYADLETNEQVTATAKVAALDALARYLGMYRGERPVRVEIRFLPPCPVEFEQ